MEGIKKLRSQVRHLVIVTNEIFSEAASYEGDTIRYQEYLGIINQNIGKMADEVVEVVYGIPIWHKGGKIIENAVELAHKLGYECPKVALLGAVEVINPVMMDTLDAAALCKMNERGQIKGCVLDGPLALDNAVSAEAARHKKIKVRWLARQIFCWFPISRQEMS